MLRRVGLIGDPVARSVSPAFQQAAFDALGIDARYEAWLTPARDLAARVAALRDEDALGANVTVPHKQAVMTLLDLVDGAARRTASRQHHRQPRRAVARLQHRRCRLHRVALQQSMVGSNRPAAASGGARGRWRGPRRGLWVARRRRGGGDGASPGRWTGPRRWWRT
ncbi:MAG: hypothetical protein U0531_02270 [Dehalococcoidia bacterium]